MVWPCVWQAVLKHDPHCGHLFVFRGKRGALVKILWHDGQGMCLITKRLARGHFIWPTTVGGPVTITSGDAHPPHTYSQHQVQTRGDTSLLSLQPRS